ncbi:MAG: chain-length determining protein [Pseudomonadota bacterium]
METQATLTTDDFIQIIKRRRWSLVLPALAIFIIAAVISLVLEPVYRSTSTILIEDQDISRDYVVATGTSFVEQRLQTINQRIMSSSRLLEIINKFNLYADKRDKMTTEEIVGGMRNKDIKFAPITSDVVDPRTGRPSMATIAFTVSYEGRNPTVVQEVANVLASLYLEENIKFKEQQNTNVLNFLSDEVTTIQNSLQELEKKIAVYKEKNSLFLPERYQANLQVVEQSERDADRMKDQLRALQERESALQSQLASIPPTTNRDTDRDTDRLNERRSQLVNLKTRVSDQYPDVIKLKAEIAELEKQIGSEGRPAVDNKPPDNPIYITLTAQLASIRSEIQSAKRQIADFLDKKREYSQRLQNSPRVEEGYQNLVVERNTTQTKYDDLMKKFMEAKVASGLEKGQMGQRFTLISPAQLPEKPVKPNRLAILLIGLILGIGSGVGTASFMEYADHSVRNAEALTKATSFAVLAIIPDIMTSQDTTVMQRKRILIAVSIVLLIIVGVTLFHFFIMDLDVLWARLMRRLAV